MTDILIKNLPILVVLCPLMMSLCVVLISNAFISWILTFLTTLLTFILCLQALWNKLKIRHILMLIFISILYILLAGARSFITLFASLILFGGVSQYCKECFVLLIKQNPPFTPLLGLKS